MTDDDGMPDWLFAEPELGVDPGPTLASITGDVMRAAMRAWDEEELAGYRRMWQSLVKAYRTLPRETAAKLAFVFTEFLHHCSADWSIQDLAFYMHAQAICGLALQEHAKHPEHVASDVAKLYAAMALLDPAKREQIEALIALDNASRTRKLRPSKQAEGVIR